MKLNTFKNANEAKDFSEEFLNELEKYSFGTMSKSSIDCFIFYLLDKYNLIPGTTNRQKAESLCITESALKNYALKSNMQYTPNSIKDSMKKLSESLSGKNPDTPFPPLTFDRDYILLVIENPVVRTDFISCLKNEGIFSDASFNKEVVKMKTAAFVTFFVGIAKDNEEKDKILNLLKADEADEETVKTLQIQNWGTREFIEEAVKVVKNSAGDGSVKCIINLFSFALEVITKKMTPVNNSNIKTV